MIFKFFRKYWLFIVTFLTFDYFLYLLKLNESSILTYINLYIYFLLFIVFHETLGKTKLNKDIIILFYVLYGYLTIFTSFTILLRDIRPIGFFSWLYYEIILKYIILVISIYIALSSFRFFMKNQNHKLLFSLFLGSLAIGLNYFQFIISPLSFNGVNWAVSNYVSMVISIIALLIFWIRYYKKQIILTEYLNLIVFLFTLSNISEALYFIAFQNGFSIFIDSQKFNFLLNSLMLAIWFGRLKYLQSEISIENERYLINFQYLNGLVSKPKQSILTQSILSISSHLIFGAIFTIIILILGLYLINKITFYLLLNTIFVLIAVILALFFSFSSIKRDWHNQFGFLFKNSKKI